jgi:hypothetical protein
MRSATTRFRAGLALGTVLLLCSSAKADPARSDASASLRLGAGATASYFGGNGFGGGGEALVGFDDGPFSVRFAPAIAYSASSAYPHTHFSLATLSLEFAFRPTPYFELSAAPLLGYTWASTPPPCYDVCYETTYTTGVTTGGTISPATIVFGPRRAGEVGFRVSLVEYPQTGWVEIAGTLGLRWFFLSFGD